jgi:hypothetical protein
MGLRPQVRIEYFADAKARLRSRAQTVAGLKAVREIRALS